MFQMCLKQQAKKLQLECSLVFFWSPAGVIDGYSTEYDVMSFALKNTSYLSNVTINLQIFNLSENINVYNQGRPFNVL